jgi:lysozyme family protein
MTFESCLPYILKEEGGFIDHPEDPGGATNHGITRKTWETFTGKKATIDDIKKLTISDVTPAYKKLYWDKVRGDELPLGVNLAVFDFAVNSGPTTAIRHLQKVADVEADGIFGPDTKREVWAMDANQLIFDLCQSRYLFLHSLDHFPTFGRGWTSRISRILSASLSLRLN